MVQALLADRFQMKSHIEDRTIEAFTLVAANPHMTKADPLNRTGCKNGPGPDGKDPRIANPVLSRLVHCQNMTMAQFAEQLPSIANGYVFTPVLDSNRPQGRLRFHPQLQQHRPVARQQTSLQHLRHRPLRRGRSHRRPLPARRHKQTTRN